jgi:hypothetical protein
MSATGEEGRPHHAQLINPPSIGLPYAGTGVFVAVPLWIVEQQVPAETRHARPHIHVDHLYLAIAAEPEPERAAELPFTWYAQVALDELDMFPDSRAGADLLFAHIGDYTRHVLDPAAR